MLSTSDSDTSRDIDIVSYALELRVNGVGGLHKTGRPTNSMLQYSPYMGHYSCTMMMITRVNVLLRQVRDYTAVRMSCERQLRTEN